MRYRRMERTNLIEELLLNMEIFPMPIEKSTKEDQVVTVAGGSAGQVGEVPLETGITRRNFLLLMQLAGLAAASAPVAAQMVTGKGMGNFDDVFGVKPEARVHQYAALFTQTSRAGNIFYPGEKVQLSFQLQNLSTKPIECRGKVDIIAYGTRGIPGNIWKPEVVKIGEVGSVPIQVNMKAGSGFQDFTIEPVIPEINGGYSLVVDLGKYGIQVISLIPGPIYSKGSEPDEHLDSTAATLLGRFGRMREISDLIGFLLSERNSFMTGNEIIVDGGRLISRKEDPKEITSGKI